MRVLCLCSHEGREGESDCGEEDAEAVKVHSGATNGGFDGPKTLLYVL